MDLLATLIQIQRNGLVAQINSRSVKNVQRTTPQCVLIENVGMKMPTIAAKRQMVVQNNMVVSGNVTVGSNIIFQFPDVCM